MNAILNASSGQQSACLALDCGPTRACKRFAPPETQLTLQIIGCNFSLVFKLHDGVKVPGTSEPRFSGSDKPFAIIFLATEIRCKCLAPLPLSGIEAADHLDGRVHYSFQRVWLNDFDGVAGGVIDAASSTVASGLQGRSRYSFGQEGVEIATPRRAHLAPARCGLLARPGFGRG